MRCGRGPAAFRRTRAADHDPDMTQVSAPVRCRRSAGEIAQKGRAAMYADLDDVPGQGDRAIIVAPRTVASCMVLL